jgi:hypothetical protein
MKSPANLLRSCREQENNGMKWARRERNEKENKKTKEKITYLRTVSWFFTQQRFYESPSL